jgi:hypothetical protein
MFFVALLAATSLPAQVLPVSPVLPARRSSPVTADETLRQGFANPPEAAKLRAYWWWLNGNTTEETITRDLTELSRKGFGGVLLVDANGADQNGNDAVPPGPTFGSPAWTKLYLHALKTAAALHLEVTLNIMSGWNLGSPDVKPEEASKLLTWSRVQFENGRYTGTLPMPAVKNGFYREIAVLAYPLCHGAPLPGKSGDKRSPISGLEFKSAARETGFSMSPSEPLLKDFAPTKGEEDAQLSEVVNLSDKMDAAGHIDWKSPSGGSWEILRIGYTDSDARISTSSGAWQGLAIDYLDRGAFDTYWSRSVAPLLDVARPYLKTTLVSLTTDSWELGGTNWTGRFADEFRRRRGYDPVSYLPVVTGRIIQDRETSNRFLNDLRRTVGDLITDHYDHFAERAKEYGLGLQAEPGGPHGAPIDGLETFRSSEIPQTEYWAPSAEHRTRDDDRFFTKEAASAANIYGKRFVAQEGMTSIGPQWSESLATDLKPALDRAFTEGMNRLVWHAFTSSPASAGLPGNEYFAGTHLNPNITWWRQSDDFFRYINRSQFLLEQGYAVNDVLYFYGDLVPNFVRLKREDPAHALPGFDYDVVNEDALLHSLAIKDGAIESPSGNRYSLLVLPTSRRLSLSALERIANYVKDGGSIAGLVPTSSTGLVSEAESRKEADLIREVWGDCAQPMHSYGKGRVLCTSSAHTALQQLQVQPDFVSSSPQLDYVHRRDAATEIYFVRNGSSEAVEATASFRVSGSVPQLWNALDGTTIVPAYTSQGEITQVPLHLAPYGSIFVVFGAASRTQGALNSGDRVQSARIIETGNVKQPSSQLTSIDLPAKQWTLTFQADRGAPAEPQKLQQFSSWSESTDARIRYFSGTAIYRTSVNLRLSHDQRVVLRLSALHEICTVKVNGNAAGTIWAMPYELDLTGKLSNGKNTIELEVTNLWPNRIIGDAQPSAVQTFTHTNIRKYKADSPLLPSGLVGPVVLELTPRAEREESKRGTNASTALKQGRSASTSPAGGS